jgi:hypothetical protein
VVLEIERVSTLSTVEFINIVGHYHTLASGYSDNSNELEARGYSPEAIAQVKRLKDGGFEGLKTVGLYFKRPPYNFTSDILHYALTLFENYERGVLPFPGSLSEQPAQILEIFSVLRALRNERELLERKKLDNGRKQHKGKSRNHR